MERLTKKGFDYCAEYCARSADCGFFKHEVPTPCGDAAIYNRLAEYEDTGLEPEEIKGPYDALKSHLFDVEGNLNAYQQAEAEGRLQVLPCAPGNIVWALERDRTGAAVDFSGYMFLAQTRGSVIVTPFVNDMEDVRDTLDYLEKDTRLNDYVDLAVFPASDCFLTREEAEAALTKEEADHADL